MIKSMVGFLIVALALWLSLAAMPHAARAQSEKENKEKEVEREEEDDDESLTEQDRKSTKLSINEARVIALKRVRGKIVDEELEKENGRLQYAFDIRDNSGKLWDVEIDAMTGEVLQAVEDDVDDDTESSRLERTKHLVYRAANSVKIVTIRVVDLVFH